MAKPITSNRKTGIAFFKQKTGFYKLGRKKYFERLDLSVSLCVTMLFIIGGIRNNYEFDSFITNTLNIIFVLLLAFSVIATAFSIWNDIKNNKNEHKSTLFAYLPYILLTLIVIIVIIAAYLE